MLPSVDFHYVGPDNPQVVFVLNDEITPTPIERLRGEPLVHGDAVAFEKRYLAPLGMKREHVGLAWCNSGAEIKLGDFVEKHGCTVVYLGDATGIHDLRLRAFVRADGVWKNSHREETVRKMKALRRILDAKAGSIAPSFRPLLKAARPHDADGIQNAKAVTVHKALAPKQIVYGVVLDPYQFDLQGDWIPPESLEDTAHDFVAKHGYISYQHDGLADAQLVESFIEEYPTPGDREKAHRGLPHRATRRKYGSDTVHSGAWVIGVKLSDKLWAEHLAGNLNAFSIEGFGTRTPVEGGEMPQVTFLDVETVS